MSSASIYTGWKPVLQVKFGDYGCVVAGALLNSGFFVDVTCGGFFGEWFSDHDMVESPAEISFEGIGQAVVPEGVLPGFVAVFSEYVD